MKRILIINGPNLNLLGSRQTDIYGKESFESYLEKLQLRFKEITLDYQQSNDEATLIDFLHQSDHDAIVINGGAYSHSFSRCGKEY